MRVVPEGDGLAKALRILGQGLVQGGKACGIDLIVSSVLHLLEQHQQTLLKHEQLRRLFPETVDRSLHLLLLGHRRHSRTGDFGQLRKGGLGTLLVSGRSLSISGFDLRQGRL